MSFTLIIGNKNYSSWSMRAWLLLKFIEVPFEEIFINLYTEQSRSQVKALGGQTGLVPVLKTGEVAIWDTLAITEYLYESFPQIWPKSQKERAMARSFVGEVHSSFNDLRHAMPVNTRGRNRKATIAPQVESDIQRVIEIWEFCHSQFNGSWLFGEFCVADIMFAPLATRFQTYDIPLSGAAKDYQTKILAHPLVAEWLELGLKEKLTIKQFELPS